ncbi:uncharacterized protein PAC_02965 [Phialocephala subalpina]|uniref:Uncharacterized protein n=1 Tax=Phialocephala subalpina TaxID=576137 RepID=A0A1L7WJX5_9HELO|nr:uncharacterized protein PAC_02965 [Phialocephala subalpina]
MASPMLLYASDFTYFPRRVLIYLKEKKIEDGIVTKVHTLFTPQRTTESSPDFPPKPPGSIPILAIPDGKDGTSHTFANRSPSSTISKILPKILTLTSKLLLRRCEGCPYLPLPNEDIADFLNHLVVYFRLHCLSSQVVQEGGYMQSVTIADCLLMSLLQYGIEFYKRDITEGLPKLKEFYERFSKRESAVIEGGYPEEMQKVCSTWLEGTY